LGGGWVEWSGWGKGGEARWGRGHGLGHEGEGFAVRVICGLAVGGSRGALEHEGVGGGRADVDAWSVRHGFLMGEDTWM
jgi:hypothetical protein